MSDDFERAAEYMRATPVKISQEQKLKLYALFKHASEGACNTARPGMLDFVGRAKWDAWKALSSDLTSPAAKAQYIAEVERIVPTWREAAAACNGRQASDAKDGGGDGLEEDDGGVGGGRGGGGLGLGPSVSTFALEVEDPETCKTDLCYLASINDVKGIQEALLANSSPTTQIDFQDEEGQTALHFAADRGHLPLLQLLVDSRASINIRTVDGQTPLHYAAAADQEDACKLLVAAGADRTMKDDDGSTASDAADSAAVQALLAPPA